MNQAELQAAHDSFITERVAILIHDSGLVYGPGEAEKEAERLWERYRKQWRLIGNE